MEAVSAAENTEEENGAVISKALAALNTSPQWKGDVIEQETIARKWWDAEAVIRPTGITDPIVHVRPSKGQVDDLLLEIRERTAKGERVLVTTLTKQNAEDLNGYFTEQGVRSDFLHSGVKPLARLEILRNLRRGGNHLSSCTSSSASSSSFSSSTKGGDQQQQQQQQQPKQQQQGIDVLVGVNLLREGLNLPEVSDSSHSEIHSIPLRLHFILSALPCLLFALNKNPNHLRTLFKATDTSKKK